MSRLDSYHDALTQLETSAADQRLQALAKKPHGKDLLTDLSTIRRLGTVPKTHLQGEVEIRSYESEPILTSVAQVARKILRTLGTSTNHSDSSQFPYADGRTYVEAYHEPSF